MDTTLLVANLKSPTIESEIKLNRLQLETFEYFYKREVEHDLFTSSIFRDSCLKYNDMSHRVLATQLMDPTIAGMFPGQYLQMKNYANVIREPYGSGRTYIVLALAKACQNLQLDLMRNFDNVIETTIVVPESMITHWQCVIEKLNMTESFFTILNVRDLIKPRKRMCLTTYRMWRKISENLWTIRVFYDEAESRKKQDYPMINNSLMRYFVAVDESHVAYRQYERVPFELTSIHKFEQVYPEIDKLYIHNMILFGYLHKCRVVEGSNLQHFSDTKHFVDEFIGFISSDSVQQVKWRVGLIEDRNSTMMKLKEVHMRLSRQECCICLASFNTKMILKCCIINMCLNCYVRLDNCPYCRSQIDKVKIQIGDEYVEKFAKIKETPMNGSKILIVGKDAARVVELVANFKDVKFPTSFESVTVLSGTPSKQHEFKFEKFQSYDGNVMFIEEKSICGYDYNIFSDLIILDGNINPKRFVRIGRKSPLFIHTFHK